MDYTEMNFALKIYEKAVLIRNRHLFRTPEVQRDAEAKKYTLEIAINEVVAEIKKVASIIKANGN
jgi:hypothetical protein